MWSWLSYLAGCWSGALMTFALIAAIDVARRADGASSPPQAPSAPPGPADRRPGSVPQTAGAVGEGAS